MNFTQKSFALPVVAVAIVLLIAGVYMQSNKAEAPVSDQKIETTSEPKSAVVVKKAPIATTSDVTVVKFPDYVPDVKASASTLSGSVPLSVRFAIPDISGVDYEGLGVYYSIVYGDGQAAGFSRKPPFSITHNYTTPGTYTAVVTVSTQCSTRECLGQTKIVSSFNILVNTGLRQ